MCQGTVEFQKICLYEAIKKCAEIRRLKCTNIISISKNEIYNAEREGVVQGFVSEKIIEIWKEKNELISLSIDLLKASHKLWKNRYCLDKVKFERTLLVQSYGLKKNSKVSYSDSYEKTLRNMTNDDPTNMKIYW